MAKYHEIGRFSVREAGDQEVDWDAALFHEEYAAQLGVLEAITTLARLHLGLQRDVLVNCTVEVCFTVCVCVCVCVYVCVCTCVFVCICSYALHCRSMFHVCVHACACV